MANRSGNYKTRDPKPTNRTPKIEQAEAVQDEPKQRSPRRYIAANMPTVCPDCGHATRMSDGRHVDPVRKTILEYRTCKHCGELLAAGRPMTGREVERLCGFAGPVSDYEQTLSEDRTTKP